MIRRVYVDGEQLRERRQLGFVKRVNGKNSSCLELLKLFNLNALQQVVCHVVCRLSRGPHEASASATEEGS